MTDREKYSLYEEQVYRMVSAFGKIYSDYPRLDAVTKYIKLSYNYEVPTMAVTPIFNPQKHSYTGFHDFYWNPSFVSTLSEQQITGCIIHELWHILQRHTTTRAPELKESKFDKYGNMYTTSREDKENLQLWNIAADISINPYIRGYLCDEKAQNKKIGVYPEDIQMPDRKSAEWYFKELKKKSDEQKKQIKEIYDKLKSDIHDMWKDVKDYQKQFGNKSDSDNQSGGMEIPIPEEIEKDLQKIADDLGLSKMAGNSTDTSSVIKLEYGREKKVPGWMKKTTNASIHGFEMVIQNSRKVPNRRYGIQFPGKKRQQLANKIIVAVDVSGSIDNNLYEEFTKHLQHLQNKYAEFNIVSFNSSLLDKNGKSIDDCNCTTAIRTFHKKDKLHIGGGTDFEPVVKLWNRVHRKYDGLFIFTDGEAQHQTKPMSIKAVNWIIYNSSNEESFGGLQGNKFFMTQEKCLTYSPTKDKD